MASCIFFGGAGFVGTHLAKFLLDNNLFSRICIADIKASTLNHEGITSKILDVRNPIDPDLWDEIPDWIFNFAAIHREPGHEWNEYFETNIKGAQNVCSFAESIGCKNIFFTSSIAVYGPCLTPTDETSLPKPISAYGGSKYPAELIHQIWANKNAERRLVITRPGVIYGPGDPGNILRMIMAIKKGYFVFPGSKKIHKSYAYIYGFIDSIWFTMNRSEKILIYNYVETPTESIEEIARHTKIFLSSSAPVISVPAFLLMPIAKLMQMVKGKNTPIHPVRVRKAGTPTHIVPKRLAELGFKFEYDFGKSLIHWKGISGNDFV